MRIDPDMVEEVAEQFYEAAVNRKFHNNQIWTIYSAADQVKLDYVRILARESDDIYSAIRQTKWQRIQNLADQTLDQEKRLILSDILKSMDEATLDALNRDLIGEGVEDRQEEVQQHEDRDDHREPSREPRLDAPDERGPIGSPRSGYGAHTNSSVP